MTDRQSPSHYRTINALMKAFNEAPSAESRKALRDALELDETNFSAFLVLFDSLKHPRSKAKIQIFEPGRDPAGAAVAYPTAIAPKAVLEKLPFVNYSDLLANREMYSPVAAKAALWVKKMQAGTGSTVIRNDYLKSVRELGESTHIGAKGTDLYAEISSGDRKEKRSIAELQIMQLLMARERNEFCEIVFQDLVSTETMASLDRIWKKTSHTAMKVERFVQAQVPCIDESQSLSYNRCAPSGHWIFAVDAIRAALHDESRPKTSCQHLVATIGNGEDLSSTPDAAMVGWMIKEKIPVVMITTEKTSNDLKGGQIALVRSLEGEDYVTIVEQAQAKEAGQLDLFEKLGVSIKNDDQVAFFNTNMALFNYDVLVPELKKLSQKIGERAFLDLLAPDLIMNWKEQIDLDGVVRKYLQIEGAMGSSLLNFDRYWRREFGRPLVHFINVESQHRTKFFSPIKTAFDYFMQFHSDRFTLDQNKMELNHVGRERLPLVTLKDPPSKDLYYADVSTVLTNFAGAQIKDLTSLSITGKISARGMKLSGRVAIENRLSEVVNAASMTVRETGVAELKNQKLVIDERGRPTVTSL